MGERMMVENKCLEGGHRIFPKEQMGDVSFIVGPMGTHITVNKSILAAESDVFMAMFYGSLVEQHEIRVPEVSTAAFKEFIQFFYLTEVVLTAEHVQDVLYLADKYAVEKAVHRCTEFMTHIMTNDNVLSFMEKAILHEQKDLQKSCEIKLMEQTETIFQSDHFLEASLLVLTHIYAMNMLCMPEPDLFEKLIEWVEVHVRARLGVAETDEMTITKAMVLNEFGDTYYSCIRFGEMSAVELTMLTKKYPAILGDDIIDILSATLLHEPSKFLATGRYLAWDENRVLQYDRKTINNNVVESENFAKYENLGVQVYKPIVWGGITVLGSILISDWIDGVGCTVDTQLEVIEYAPTSTGTARTLLEMNIIITPNATKWTSIDH